MLMHNAKIYLASSTFNFLKFRAQREMNSTSRGHIDNSSYFGCPCFINLGLIVILEGVVDCLNFVV